MFNKDDILSNKIIMSHDGILYQVCRKRNGLLHSIELSYNMINGIKTIRGKFLSPRMDHTNLFRNLYPLHINFKGQGPEDINPELFIIHAFNV